MSKQRLADVPGVPVAAVGVSVGDAGSTGRVADASGFAVSALVMAGTGTGD